MLVKTVSETSCNERALRMHIAVDLDAAVSVFLLNAAVLLLLQRYCSAAVAAAKLSMLQVSCIAIGFVVDR